MIQFLRKHSVKKYIFIAVAIAVTFSFVIWGVKFGDEKPLPTALATFENKKITLQNYLNSYKAVQHEMMLVYGEEFQKVSPYMNLKGEAWDRLLLLFYADKNNIRTTDQEVVEWIGRQPVFWTGGKFDTLIYKRYVASFMGNRSQDMAISTREFEEEIRQMLTLDKVRTTVKSKAVLNDAELREAYNLQNSEKDLTYATIDWESVQAEVKIEDSELEKLYPLFKGQFHDEKNEPLPAEQAKEKIKQLMMKQKATQVAVEKLKKVKEEAAKSGFDQALQANGLTRQTLEKFKAGMEIPGIGPVPAVERTVMGLRNQEISDALPTPKGAVLLQVTQTYSADDKKYEEEKEKFKETAILGKASEDFRQILQDLRSKLKINAEVYNKIFPEDEKAPQ